MIDYLNVPEHLLNQPIEPWQPRIGMWVRITAAIAECEWEYQHYTVGLGEKLREVSGHSMQELGAIGQVTEIIAEDDPDFEPDSHPYVVTFLSPIEDHWGLAADMCYAACELEPLDGEQ